MNDYLRLNQSYSGYCMKFEDATRKRLKDKKCLEYYGFKVYSQNEEDGIIEEIFNRVGTTNKNFIEFGVGNGLECNSHYLLFKGWRGLWIEGEENYVKEIHERFAPVLANGQLKFLQAHITRENINDLFIKGGFEGEIDLLSIDVDGNDYYIWQAINVVRPRVVIVEYNAKFPPNCDWKQAYNKRHMWDDSDWQGASLKALELLGRRLGYQLVGTNLNGVNAFFVRKDLAKDLFIEPATAENLYNSAKYYLRYMNGHPPRYCLAVQHENFGILDYRPNCDAIPLEGFYDETRNDNLKFHIMSGKRAKILVRNKEKVVLPYFLPNDKAENLSLTVKIFGRDSYTVPVQINGLIEMEFPPAEEPWEVELELSTAFVDMEGKIFGLAIIFEVN